jgi:integrase
MYIIMYMSSISPPRRCSLFRSIFGSRTNSQAFTLAVYSKAPAKIHAYQALSGSQRPRTLERYARVHWNAGTRAKITTGDVTLHTLRHTALSRMVASGYDDYR